MCKVLSLQLYLQGSYTKFYLISNLFSLWCVVTFIRHADSYLPLVCFTSSFQRCSGCPRTEEILLSEDAPVSRRPYRETAQLRPSWQMTYEWAEFIASSRLFRASMSKRINGVRKRTGISPQRIIRDSVIVWVTSDHLMMWWWYKKNHINDDFVCDLIPISIVVTDNVGRMYITEP